MVCLKFLLQIQQCQDCDGGHYCDHEHATNVSGKCWPGYYCESGVDRPNPNNALNSNSTYNASCPIIGGHTGEFCISNLHKSVFVRQ